MPSLYETNRKRAAEAALRSAIVGKTWHNGRITYIAVDITRDQNVVLIPLGWFKPSLFRWRKRIPAIRDHYTGNITPERIGMTHWTSSGPPLPRHQPHYWSSTAFFPEKHKKGSVNFHPFTLPTGT